MGKLDKYQQAFETNILDNEKRYYFQFVGVCLILALVAAAMSVVNVITAKWPLFISTSAFSVLCLVNIGLFDKGQFWQKLAALLFSVEILVLLVFFIVTGSPEGFSAIWACVVPTTALLLFQRKRGSLLCLAVFAVLVFFFDTPVGNSFLQYPYTESFKLRFPMLYVAFYALSFFLETVRSITYEAMRKSRRQYEHLYAHDALTGVLNRYGFNTRLDRLLRTSKTGLALIILDIDHFKNVNDTYGHPGGDDVLTQLAALLKSQTQGKALVCRWGGEEFALLCRSTDQGFALAEQLRAAVDRSPFRAAGHRLHVTISLGVVGAPRGIAVEAAELVRQTDACLYRAKQQGRNRVIQSVYHGGEAVDM